MQSSNHLLAEYAEFYSPNSVPSMFFATAVHINQQSIYESEKHSEESSRLKVPWSRTTFIFIQVDKFSPLFLQKNLTIL
jgi:hypothetical protein